MEILLVSDNHGLIEPIEYVLKKHKDIENRVHCGDFELPLRHVSQFSVVNGNNDYSSLPKIIKVNYGDHRILIMHGHPYASIFDLSNLANYAKKEECNTVFFGHTHIFADVELNGVRLINPGSLSHNRDGSRPSYAIVTVDEKSIKVKKMELI